MSLPPNIRVNAQLPFPSRVQGQNIISVSKANGLYTIKADLTTLATVLTPNATQQVLLWDEATGAFTIINAKTFVGLANGYRTVNASGNIVSQPTDGTILLNNVSGGPINVVLPLSANQNGIPITVKDIGGNANTYNITFVPNGTETIDGFNAAAAAANGIATISINYAKKTLFPLTGGGWYVL